jgi:hypothetical protein
MKNIWHIEIEADKPLYWYSKLTGTNGNAKAAAFYPFLITTSKIHPKMKEYFINHELIHFAQQKEMLIVGGWIFHFFEYLGLARTVLASCAPICLGAGWPFPNGSDGRK